MTNAISWRVCPWKYSSSQGKRGKSSRLHTHRSLFGIASLKDGSWQPSQNWRKRRTLWDDSAISISHDYVLIFSTADTDNSRTRFPILRGRGSPAECNLSFHGLARVFQWLGGWRMAQAIQAVALRRRAGAEKDVLGYQLLTALAIKVKTLYTDLWKICKWG